jgi:O-antigen ligase
VGKKQSSAAKSIDSGIVTLLLTGAAITTLYFNTKIQDPFNSPKLWIISLLAAWSAGHIFAKWKMLFSAENKVLTLIMAGFLGIGLIALIQTDSFYIGLFGESQRRNGYLNYLSLGIILLIASIVFRFNSLNKIYLVTLGVGAILSIYGLLQSSGLDFVKWNNPYNSVISTVGNPNFAAAIMAIMATLNFGAALNTSRKSYLRILHIIVTIFIIYVISLSDALQGLIVTTIGIGTIILVLIFNKSKTLGLFAVIGAGLISVVGILGMLQIGPLTQYLYKNSVSVRGYYWRAGIEMLQNNFIFGVGLDRYGAHFRQVRESSYSLNYGFDITSNNAHNMPIQMFSTGGVFLGVAYLALLIYILYCGVKGLRKFQGNQRVVIATFFGAWIAYQAQTIISIDNIGVSIWGWLLGGIVVALSRSTAAVDEKYSPANKQIKLLQPLTSGILTILILVMVSGLYRAETSMYQTRGFYNPQDPSIKAALLKSANETINTPLIEPAYVITSANYLFASGYPAEAIEILKDQITKDNRDLDAITSLVQIYEQNKDYRNAMLGREQIRELDPWNSKNLLQLGREYQLFGDYDKMIEVLDQINSFDKTSSEAELANLELIRKP